jgi:hypothetical protein
MLLQQVEEEERQLQQQGMGQWLWSYGDLSAALAHKLTRQATKLVPRSSILFYSMATCKSTSREGAVVTVVMTHAAAADPYG